MSFLTLAQDAQRECDVVGTSMISVTNQVGELNRIVQWMIACWIEIQNRHTNWRWMRSRFTYNTVAGVDSQAPATATDAISLALIGTRFARWLLLDDRAAANVKIYQQAAGVATERWLSFVDYSSFREMYKRGTVNNAPPAHYTLDPLNNLLLGPPPDGIYVVTGEYMKGAQVLALDADIPELPLRFHQLLVFMTMKKYAGFEAAPDVHARAVTEGNRMMRQLELDQLPTIAAAAPMA